MIFFHFQIFVKLDKNILTIMPDLHENINDLTFCDKNKSGVMTLDFKVSIVKPELKNASHKLKLLDQNIILWIGWRTW